MMYETAARYFVVQYLYRRVTAVLRKA